MDDVQELITCSRCGQLKPAHASNRHLCVDCCHVEDTRVTYFRQHQGDWIAEAREQGIPVWQMQPGETQREYSIWVAYRDIYPGKKPTYASVAEELGTTYNVVKKVSQRWSFPLRMQLWMAECDRITLIQRRNEILSMNEAHIKMASTLRAKMAVAIDSIDPMTLKPSEISSLLKTATELERKAQIDTVSQEEMRRELLVDTLDSDVKKVQTKTSDLQEVLQILIKTGAIQNPAAIGIKETTTREIVAIDHQ